MSNDEAAVPPIPQIRFFLFVRKRYLHRFSPVPQSLLTDAAGRQHPIFGILVITDQSHTVRYSLVAFVCLEHGTRFNAHRRRGVGGFNRNTRITVAFGRMNDARTAPAHGTPLFDQLRSSAIPLIPDSLFLTAKTKASACRRKLFPYFALESYTVPSMAFTLQV